MELLEFVTKLAATHTNNDKEKYWRTIVHCFLIDKLEQIQLGTLPNHFTQRYGRAPNYDGKLSALLQEPEFKAICNSKKVSTGIWLQPSEFLKLILSGRLGVTNVNARNNNNENSIVTVDSNPFAILAQKEKEEGSADQNQHYEARVGRLTLEELNCGICFDLLKDAVEGDCCKNIFCLPCIEQNNRKCPNCRRAVEWSVNEPIRRLAGKRPVQCEFKDCSAWSTVSEIEQHRFGCEFNPENFLISCQKCQQQIMRRLLEEHLSDTCEMVEVPCRLCGFMSLRKDINNHETQLCEMAEVPCPSCYSMVRRKDLTYHEERQCSFRRVLCSHGCGEHMTYSEFVNNHSNRCSYQSIKCSNRKCTVLVQKRLLDGHLAECKYSKRPCIHSVRGCEVEYTMDQRAAWCNHILVCRFRLVLCPHGCNAEMLKHKVKKHRCDYMPVECAYCHGTFKEKDLLSHVREECPSYMVECDLCHQQVAKISLDEHKSSICTGRITMCHKCRLWTGPSHRLTYHEQHECPTRLVKCHYCMQPFSADELERHLSERLCPKRRVVCAFCFEKFVSEEHICPKRRVQCLNCEKFVDACNINRHQSQRCPKRLIECNLCYEDVVAMDLDSHRNECPERNVQCSICNQWMAASLVEPHQSSSCEHRNVRCSWCYATVIQRFLSHHMSKKCPERLIPCSCGRDIPLSAYIDHSLLHCKTRKVLCDHCSEFVTASDLEDHELHCPERIVSCQKCSVSMTLKEFQSHNCIGCIIS